MGVTEIGKGSDRLEFFGYEIVSLISNGEEESVDDVIQSLEESNAVHYILEKYNDKLIWLQGNTLYDLNEWEKVLAQYSYITFNSDVRRKMGIYNREKDGLLVLMNIILQEISERKYK